MVVVSLHRRSTREAMTTWEKYCIGSLLEIVILKLEINGMNMSQKVWNFSILTDYVIEAWRPDLVVVDYKERSCKIIDLAVPGVSRIEEKEKDKIEKYQELGRVLQKICNVKAKIIPLVTGSLSAIPKQFDNRLKQIGITLGTAQVQKTVLLGTARILRKGFEI